MRTLHGDISDCVSNIIPFTENSSQFYDLNYNYPGITGNSNTRIIIPFANLYPSSILLIFVPFSNCHSTTHFSFFSIISSITESYSESFKAWIEHFRLRQLRIRKQHRQINIQKYCIIWIVSPGLTFKRWVSATNLPIRNTL